MRGRTTTGTSGAPPTDDLGLGRDRVPPDVLDRLRRWVRTCLGLRADELVTVIQVSRPGSGGPRVGTLLAALRPSGAVRRSIPLPADLVSVADVQRAFAGGDPGTPW